MVVTMFTPARGYGFCCGKTNCSDPCRCTSEESLYFHVGVFERLTPGGPPPIVGEQVVAVRDTVADRPRALKVQRSTPPVLLRGTVMSFDPGRGWGFIEESQTKEKYFLHRSEMESMALPTRNQRVSFYAGVREGKKRACYISLLTG